MPTDKLASVGTCFGFDPGRINFAFGTFDDEGVGDNHGDAEGIEDVLLLPFFRERLWRKMKRHRYVIAVFIERYHMRPNSAGAITSHGVKP